MTASLAALLALAGGIALGWAVRGLYEAHRRDKQALRTIYRQQGHAPEVKARKN